MNKKIKYIFIAIFIISAMLSFYLLNKKAEGTTAVIYQNGKIIKKINLNTVSSPYEFDINGEKYTNTVHVKKGRICIIKADCPDNTCVHQGYISDGVSPIVCLPNKITIKIEDDENDIDILSQ